MALSGTQVETTRLESGELFQEMVEFLPEAVFRVDADLRLTYANPTALEMIGVSPSDLSKGLSLLEYVDEADRARVVRMAGELGPGRRSNPAVFKARRSDGSTVFIEVIAAPIFGENGKISGLWGAGRDVTQRVQSDKLESIINGLRHSLAATSDLPEALEQVLDAALLLDGLDSGCIYVADPVSGVLVLAAPRGLSTEFVNAVGSIESNEFHMGPLDKWGEGKVAHFTREGIEAWPNAVTHTKEGLRAAATLPVIDAGRPILLMAVSSHTVDELPLSTIAGLQELSLTLNGPIARIRAEQSRREVAETLEGLLAAAPLAIYSLDLSGNVTMWNAAAEKMFGWTASEVLGSLLPTVPESTLEEFHESLYAAAAGGSLEPLEYPSVPRKDGSTIAIRLSRSLLHDHRGRLVGHVCVNEDVTEKRRMEESLRVTQFCVDRAKDMIFWTDSIGRLRYVSESTCSSLGYSREELLGMSVFEVDPNAKMIPAKQWMEQTEGSRTFESVYRTKGGDIFPVEVTVNYSKYDGEVLHFAFARDISERKQVEEELRLTQFSVDRAADLIYWLDPTGRIILANEASCRRDGYTR